MTAKSTNIRMMNSILLVSNEATVAMMLKMRMAINPKP